jgi:hypothetical protein
MSLAFRDIAAGVEVFEEMHCKAARFVKAQRVIGDSVALYREVYEEETKKSMIHLFLFRFVNTGRTQNNGAVLIVNTIKTAPLFCVCPVYRSHNRRYLSCLSCAC